MGEVIQSDCAVGCGRPVLMIDPRCPVDVREGLCRDERAGCAVEHIEKAVLVRLHQHGAINAADLQVRQDQLLRGVVVPVIIRRRLVVPRHPTGVGMERDDRGGVQPVELWIAKLPKVVGGGVRGAEVQKTQGRIVGKAVPGRPPELVSRIAVRIPGFRRRLERRTLERPAGRRRHGIEAPFEDAARQIVRGDIAPHAAVPHVRAAVADDHDVPGDLRGAGARVGEPMVDDGIDDPDRPAGGSIDRMQPPVARRHVHLAFPHRHAAVDEVAAGISRGEPVAFRIVAPDLPAARRIERIHIAPGAGAVHASVDHDRRRFLAALRGSEVVAPGESELLHVAGIDVVQGGIISAALIAAAREPVLRLGVGRREARLVHCARGLSGNCLCAGRRRNAGDQQQ